MRCEEHGLSTGPDGLCALCRAAANERSAQKALRLGMMIIGGLAAASGGLIAFRSLLRPESATAPVARPISSEVSEVPEVREVPELSVELAAEPSEGSPLAAHGDTFDPEPASPEADAEPIPPSPAPPAPAKEPPSPGLIQATLQATPVTMFSTSWCPVCTRARAYFDANGIKYLERDIDRDGRARAELQARAGKTSVPAFLIDGSFVGPGFSEKSMTRVLLASVERRLGVRGLSVVKR